MTAAAGLLAARAGELAAVATVLLVAAVGGRLGLGVPARAAGVVFWAVGAGAVGLAGSGPVDGRAAALGSLAALLAVGGRLRNAAALLAGGAAVAVEPSSGVGVLVLLGGLLLTGDLGTRLPGWSRAGAGALLVALAAGLGAAVLTGAGPVGTPWPVGPAGTPWLGGPVWAGGPPLPVVAVGLAALAWTALVTRLLWRRLRWLRPAGLAAAALLGVAVPAGRPAALLAGVAALAVLTAVLVEEYPALLARRSLITAAALVSAGAVALAPAVPAGGDPAPARAAGAPVPIAAAGPGGPAPGGAGSAPGPASGFGPGAGGVVRAAVPVSLEIPALGLAGGLGELGVDPDTGELLAPDDPSLAGWYAAGPVPGDTGPAVIGGHVDSRRGPGVFGELATLRRGDRVTIGLSNGRTVRFEVDSVATVPKSRFPTAAVYGPTPRPELRIVTCGGRFDTAERSYTDNVVVEAVLLLPGS